LSIEWNIGPLREPKEGEGLVEVGGAQLCRDGLAEGCR
jgi:hypothetical protein